jgi:hypothetical protein
MRIRIQPELQCWPTNHNFVKLYRTTGIWIRILISIQEKNLNADPDPKFWLGIMALS